jgi:tight adherence protein C
MTVRARRRRVRARIGARAGAGARFEALGRVAARLVPPARELPAAIAGRAAAFGAAGAILLGTSAHGARAVAAFPLGAAGGWKAALALDARARRERDAGTARELPAAVDRLATCVLAGMSIERGLRLVAPGTPGLLGDAFADGLRALDAGVPRSRAYAIIAARAESEDVRALTATLARAERFGTSVSAALLAHSKELRARARARAEAESRTAPVKMIFPLVFCFLPAFVLLTIAPIALSAIRTIGGIK